MAKATGGSLTELISRSKKTNQQKPPSTANKQQQIEQELDQLFISRKSRGNQRVVFNDNIQKIPGVYNDKGNV